MHPISPIGPTKEANIIDQIPLFFRRPVPVAAVHHHRTRREEGEGKGGKGVVGDGQNHQVLLHALL